MDVNILQQDYEFRWTGVVADTVINGNTLFYTPSGGSIITLFGASGYDLIDSSPEYIRCRAINRCKSTF